MSASQRRFHTALLRNVLDMCLLRIEDGSLGKIHVLAAKSASRKKSQVICVLLLLSLALSLILTTRAAQKGADPLSNATPNSTSLNGTGNLFLTAQPFGSGISIPAFAIADFNGDGKPDLALPFPCSGCGVVIALGKGDGTFQAGASTVNLGGAFFVATGDFNGDGKQDLVVLGNNPANQNIPALFILLGNGDGTFTLKTTFLGLVQPVSIVTGDFNGDGKLDVAVVDRAGPDVVDVFLGNGDGTLQTPAQINLGVSAAANQVVAADFRNDGKLDLAVSFINQPAVDIILGNGNGTFHAPTVLALPTGNGGFGIAVGDFNGDGVPDLVATTPNIGGVSVFLGKGDGTFTPVNNPQSGTLPTANADVPDGGCTAIAVGDFNKDGKLDIVTGLSGVNGVASVSVLLGNGDGTLQSANGPGHQTLYGTVDNPSFLVVADVNGDGNLDWVTNGNISYYVAVGLGRGDGTFLAAENFYGGFGPVAEDVADFNHDGKLDLVVAASNSVDTNILLGNGDGTFQPAVSISVAGLTPADVVAGDFNNDGNPDFVVFNGSGCPNTVYTFLGKGDGTFQNPVSTSLVSCNSDNNMVVGDFNKDGKLDIAIALNHDTGNPLIQILLGKGDGTFNALTPFSTGGMSEAFLTTAALRNTGPKAGTPDLILTDFRAGQVKIFLGNGDGTFQAPTNVAAGRFPGGVVVADFNGDGNLDILLDNELDNNLEFFSGNGDGSVNSGTLINTAAYGPPPNIIIAGDFNLDGKLDIAFDHAGGGRNLLNGVSYGMSVMFGNGDGTFQAPQDYLVSRVAYPAFSRSGSIVNTDFNRDGAPDVLLIDTENFLTVLLNQTLPPLNVTPTSLSFGNQLVGVNSSAKQITLTNNGASATMIGFTVNGDFAQTNTCPMSPATLTVAAKCTVNVTFNPSTTGPRAGTLTISYNLPGGAQTLNLSGTGVIPVATLGAPSVNFPNQFLGTTSTAQMVSLKNTGTAPLLFTVAGISITGTNSGDFSQTNNCGASVAIGVTCNISITFTPSATGTRTASVSLSDDANPSSQSVALAGTGVAPAVTLSGSSIAFGTQIVGTTSTPPQKVTLTNSGTASLTLSISVTGTNSGDFIESDNCDGTVTAGSNCTITLSFKPTATGSRNASVVIADNVPGNPQQSVTLTGRGIGTSGDFDGDGKADIGVFRPSNGEWYIIPSGNPGTALLRQWGTSGDIPVRGDFDGDGKTDVAVWRPSSGEWFIIPSSNPAAPILRQWGASGDIPVPGDYDGDGKTDFAVFRPSTGTWFIIPSSNPAAPILRQWGASGDIPVPGDYDGDGKTDIAVWRPSTGEWYIIPSSNPGSPILQQWGANGDMPVPGDYDGDGKTDIAVWRPSTGFWFIIPSSNPGSPIIRQWGTSGDIPVPVDYDGDRKTDIAVWRPSNGDWYILPSASPGTFTITQWGANGDVPVQKPIGQ